MPKATYYAVYVCMYAFPISIILLSITTLATEGMQPAEIFFLLCQVGTIAWFTIDFIPTFEYYSEQCEETKETVTKILDYFKGEGFVIDSN